METAYAVWRQHSLCPAPTLSGVFELKTDAQEYVSIRTSEITDRNRDLISYEIREVKYWPRLPVQDLSK